MNNRNNIRKGLIIGTIFCSLILLGILGSYAFFQIAGLNNKQEKATVQTGTLALNFEDGSSSFQGQLEFGGSAEKTFTIENTGSLDAFAKISWEDLVNTYLESSLTYTLSYSEEENGTYKELITDKNVPKSETPDTIELVNGLKIPEGDTYYYKLTITLNHLESTDQTADLKALFSTHFKLEEGNQIFTLTFEGTEESIETKDVIKNLSYGTLPTPTRAGFAFAGWFTEENGMGEEITEETVVSLKSNQTLYAKWKQLFTITFNDGTSISEKQVTNDSSYGELPIPSKAGCTFLGWFTEENGKGIEITSETIVNLKSNQALYAHWEQLLFSNILIGKANDSSVNNYNLGVKGEMYTFSHSSTSQTPALTDYRYIGNVPNNYIKFNNETWRIIGVFSVQSEENGKYEQRIKIIRNETAGTYAWGSSITNEWVDKQLYKLLNTGDYFNRNGNYNSIGLTESSKKLISSAKWYLGRFSSNKDLSGAELAYNNERNPSTVTSGRSSKVIQNVGLMYPSDYLYTFAYGIDETCYTNGYKCSSGNLSWLFKEIIQWTQNPDSSGTNNGIYIYSTGRISYNRVDQKYNFRPCVYLRPDIEIMDGDGSSGNPYILKS